MYNKFSSYLAVTYLHDYYNAFYFVFRYFNKYIIYIFIKHIYIYFYNIL